MCYYVNKKQYEAITNIKNVIAKNMDSYTDFDVEYSGKERVYNAICATAPRSIVVKIAAICVRARGGLTNGYWYMPSTSDCCKIYKKMRRQYDRGARPVFYTEHDSDWNEDYETLTMI